MAQTIQLNALEGMESLDGFLLAVEGYELLGPGAAMSEAVLEVLRRHDFDPVVVAATREDADQYIRKTRYEPKSMDALGENESIAAAIYDDHGRLLVPAHKPIPPASRDVLKRQGVFDVLVERPVAAATELRIGRVMLRLHEATKNAPVMRVTLVELPEQVIPAERLIADPASITPDAVDQAVDAADESEFEEKPSGEPLAERIQRVDPLATRPVAKVRAMIQIHESVLRNAEQIFAQVKAREKVDGQLISALSNRVVTGLINDPNMVLNLAGLDNSRHYLVSHSINTALLSVNIAAALGFSLPQIHELAFGALLHDIGMMKVPGELIHKTTPLNAEERRFVERHPVFGINILQSISRLPKSTPLVVYQENERLDGSGYPRMRSRGRIHTYAKIVAVAAAYEAMTSDRPHRKALLPYHAMEILLKQVSAHKLDAVVVRALLKVLGLFPVGSWVRLSDGHVGRIVAANEAHYTRPVVSVIMDGRGESLPASRPLDLADDANADLSILEAISMPMNVDGDIRTIGFYGGAPLGTND